MWWVDLISLWIVLALELTSTWNVLAFVMLLTMTIISPLAGTWLGKWLCDDRAQRNWSREPQRRRQV